MSDLKAVNIDLFRRYLGIIQSAVLEDNTDKLSDHPRLSLKNLEWMCQTAISQSPDMADDKASRWLGFVQGCLAMRDLINVDEERDITRPMFHSVYKKDGGLAPGTLSRD